MTVVNDIPGAWERIRAEGERLGALTNVPREVFWGFFNTWGRFPQNIQELNQYGDTPDRIYGIRRRDPQTGAWRPIMPGTNPMYKPGGDPATDARFSRITNAEDADVERYKDFNPGILNAFGQSSIAPAADRTGDARVGLASRPMDQNNYVGPLTDGRQGFVSVVDGQAREYLDQGSAEQDYNARSGGTPPPSGAPGAGGAGGPPAAGGAPAGGTASGGGTGVGLNENAATAANAAVLAWLAKRRLEEIDIPELRLKTETELAAMRRADALAVWKQAYETATLTGTLDGQPTLDATKQRADITGYTGGTVAGRGQAGLDAIAALRTDPRYQAADAATRPAMEAATLAQTYGIDQAAALRAVTEMRALTAQTGRMSSAALLEAVVGTHAPGTATLARETEQNRTLVSTLGLLANLRGPENAFAYANTLANVPDAIRQQITAAMGRLPVAPRNPAAAGVWGDLQQQAQAQAQGVQPGQGAQDQQRVGQPVLAAGEPTASGGAPGQPAVWGTGLPGQPTTTGGGGPFQTTLPVAMGPRAAQPGMMTAQDLVPRVQPGGPQPGGFNPAQLSPTDMGRTDPYAQKLLWAGFENAGGDVESGKWRYQNSLPRAFGPRSGRLRAA